MPPCALVSIGVAESEAHPSGWDERSAVSAFHGMINAFLVEFSFGACAWALYREWPRLYQPVMAFAQHVGAAAVSAL
jgi:hypothetical protein